MKQKDRIFDDHSHLDVESIIEKINEIIKNNTVLVMGNGDLSKWINLPNVIIDSNNNKAKFLEIVIYIDELAIEISDKIKLINTVASVLITSKIEISTIEINNLFLLVYYLADVPLDQYKDQYVLFGNDSLLPKIRERTLDLEKRKQLLIYMNEIAITKQIDKTNMQQVSLFQTEMVQLLNEKSVDEILGIVNYMNGMSHKIIDFKDSLSN